jgi:hypothetical protein
MYNMIQNQNQNGPSLHLLTTQPSVFAQAA